MGSGISIVMPARNSGLQIDRAIQDLCRGMKPQDELLVIDDGSEDDTWVRAIRWAQKDERVRPIRNCGRGLVQALNQGIAVATHDWIARADADDRYPASRFCAQRLLMGPNVALISGDYRIVSGSSDLGVIHSSLGHPFVHLSLVHPNRIPHPGVMLRKSAVQDAGGYRAEDFPAEDLGLWLRLARCGNLVATGDVVVEWMRSPSAVSIVRRAEQLERTRALLRAVSDWPQVGEDELRHELKSYSAHDGAAERVLLLARDLARTQRAPRWTGLMRTFVRDLPLEPRDLARATYEINRDRHKRRAQLSRVVSAG